MREVLFNAGCGVVLGILGGSALVLCVPGQGGVVATIAACVATGALVGLTIGMVQTIAGAASRQQRRQDDPNRTDVQETP